MPRHRTSFLGMVPWIVLVILGVIAFASSFQLHRIQSEFEGFAICRVAPGFDCAPALRSRYGRLFGIPLSSYAVAYYLFCIVVSIQPLFRKRVGERNAVLMSVLTGLGSLFCAWLVYVSLTMLRAYCPFCLVLHIATPLMFLASLWAVTFRQHPIRLILSHEWETIVEDKRILAGLIVAIVLVVIGLPIYSMIGRYRQLENRPQYKQILSGEAPRQERLGQLLGDRPFRGRPDAMVTIVEFADFTCPVCMQGRIAVEDLMKIYDVKFIFVNHPLSRECNPQAEYDRPGACLGSLVSHYAAGKGPDRFWKVYDGLFNTPNLLGATRADRLAQLAGASTMAEISADTAARQALIRDLALSHEVGVSSVPTFFINGMRIEGLPDDWFFVEAVEREQDRVRSRR